MTSILYEHPLNERIRNYLKLEQLFVQVEECLTLEVALSHQVFFNALFAIIDTLERNDIRGDIIKDLEKLEQNLVVWSKSPDVDSSALQETLKETVALLCQLKTPSPQWMTLKDDKFLASLKQRFAIQGGSSSFDLPQLKFWLVQPAQKAQKQQAEWLHLLAHIQQALALILKFIRQRGTFETIKTNNGFFQESGEGLLLLRIKVREDAEYYPTVSGNKFRYSIRFMCPCEQTGRKYCDLAIPFDLARC
ncbi:cell division protein ZapD [Thalassotalea sediminis]|uniref:cell division protein ZapD n=1 Tax=Thalassotalea sediminis TaxID=1759089 RepID=UPI0025738F7D|nr:cell division protein ZapD [Thalassotalea sediminis]